MRFSLRDARSDIGVFAKAVGRPLTSWQAKAMKATKRIVVIIAPRQSGKSYALAVRAAFQCVPSSEYARADRQRWRGCGAATVG